MNQIDIIGSQWDNILILAPVKLVVVPVLREVRFQQADTRYDTAGDERVIGTVITISHPLGLGAYSRYERTVMVGVAAVNIV